jgi:hypothetical protein
MAEPYDQQPGETDLWFQRFRDFYLLVGSERHLDDAYRRHLAAGGADPAAVRRRRAPGCWREAAKRYRWEERVRPWDRERRRERQQAHEAQLEAKIEAMRKQGGAGRTAPIVPPKTSEVARDVARLIGSLGRGRRARARVRPR